MTSPFIELKQQGICWTTLPQNRFLIESLNGSLTHAQQGEVIKSSSIRRVLAIEIPHEGKKIEIFVKHHRRLAWKETIKDFLKVSKARNEWRLTHEIGSRGVPTVHPLAFGERRRWGLLRESFFVSKRIVACEPLHDLVLRETAKAMHPPQYAQQKRQLIQQLARLIALVHQKGIDHKDLHAGNILIENNGTFHFYLLDLDRARIHHKLSRRRRVAALAQFAMFFALFVSRADRLRFFKEYYRQDPTPWNGYQKWARRIEKITQKSTNRLYCRRDKSCLEENKQFRKFEVPPYGGVFRKKGVTGSLAELLRDPEKLFQDTKVDPLKRSREKTVKRIDLSMSGQKMDVILKRYLSPTLWDRLKNWARMSKAKRCWFAANALVQRRGPTASPLAYVEEKRWGLVRKNYFFYEYVPHSYVLSLYLRHRFVSPLFGQRRRQKRSLITQCAYFVRHIHERGIDHADLKGSNILVKEKGPTDFEFYLIDLDHVRICGRIGAYRRYRNLMQLNKSFLDQRILTTADRLAFLLAYLRYQSRDHQIVRRVWNRVARLTTHRLHKTSKTFFIHKT